MRCGSVSKRTADHNLESLEVIVQSTRLSVLCCVTQVAKKLKQLAQEEIKVL